MIDLAYLRGQTKSAAAALAIVIDEQGMRRDRMVRETLRDYSPDDLSALSKFADELSQLCQILAREPR